MFDGPTIQDVQSHSDSSTDFRESRVERQRLDDGTSRVSTDSDLDLESEGDEDDHRSTFSDVLMRKLIYIEQVQKKYVQEAKELRAAPLSLPSALADDSYWAKMRRVSQWRLSTQSETPSYYSPPPSISRKRRLSDASVPTSSPKRPRLASLSPAPPGSPFFPHARAYPLDSADNVSDPGAYPRSYSHIRTEVRTYADEDVPHVCTACDTTFASRHWLRHHGRGAWTPDACRAAVTYGLE